MDFNDFNIKFNQNSFHKLPGQNAHKALAPPERPFLTTQEINLQIPKKAAVLIVIHPNQNNEACFTLTERASYEGVHANQISLPGGKFENLDIHLYNTACRETFEEIGLVIDSTNKHLALTELYIPPSNFLVSPYVTTYTKTPTYSTNKEVKNVFSVSIHTLLYTSLESAIVNTSYLNNLNVPVFQFSGKIVWGATAMILNELKEVLKNLYFGETLS